MVIDIPIHLSVYNCVCVCVCMFLFRTLDVLKCNPFLAVHFLLHCSLIIALHSCVFVDFPYVSYGRLFLRPLSLHESCPQSFFVCVYIPNAIKVMKFRTISMKLWFKKIQNRNFFGQKWPKSTRGLIHFMLLITTNKIYFLSLYIFMSIW